MNTGIVKVDDNGQGYDRATSMAEFKALADEIYITDVTPPEDNPYLEPVDITPYNSDDPSHLLITEANGNWTSTNLNSAVYKHFYVEPGDYSSSIITLTQDGTENDRRSISLHDGLETHPASLSVAEQADIKIRFNDADYWDIHRMSGLSYQPESDINWFYNGASYNTLNMHNLKDYFYGIRILHASNYNTIQKCYIDTMTPEGRTSDNIGIALTTADQGEGTHIIGTKIIENDIRNACDGIQLVKVETLVDVDYEGTIIDNNNVWIDGDVYTDGSGNFTPSGEYANTEDAMDFKAGSQNASNPMYITNNRMWGMRAGDGSFGSTTSYGGGSCVSIHYGVHNTKFNSNIMFDARGSVLYTNKRTEVSSFSGEMLNNIIYDIGWVEPPLAVGMDYAFDGSEGADVLLANNTLISIDNPRYLNNDSPVGQTDINDNLFISMSNSGVTSGVGVDGNYYYDTSDKLDGSNETDGGVASNANMTDYTFTYERYTTAPKSKTVEDCISTPSSPHYGVAGSDLT